MEKVGRERRWDKGNGFEVGDGDEDGDGGLKGSGLAFMAGP